MTWWEQACVIGARQRPDGYSIVPSGRRGPGLLAHRVAWEKERGEIPAGFVLHHRCRNRACVNVEHLELLTQGEHCSRHRKCDHPDRRPLPNGKGTYCRTCFTIYARQWRRKKREAARG